MAMRPYPYIKEVILTLFGNICGAAVGGGLLNLTKLGSNICTNAADIIAAKTSDSPVSITILAIFCGILMFIAVEGNSRSRKNGDFMGALFSVVMPVMIFILCGFNHSIADFSYFFISRCKNVSEFLPYIILVILGNAVGCMFIPVIKRFSINAL